jgi:hypothetical protein
MEKAERWTRQAKEQHTTARIGPELTRNARRGWRWTELGNSSSAVDGRAAAVRMSNNCGRRWLCMDMHGCAWMCMDVDGCGRSGGSEAWVRVQAQTGGRESVNKRDHSCAPEPGLDGSALARSAHRHHTRGRVFLER